MNDRGEIATVDFLDLGAPAEDDRAAELDALTAQLERDLSDEAVETVKDMRPTRTTSGSLICARAAASRTARSRS